MSAKANAKKILETFPGADCSGDDFHAVIPWSEVQERYGPTNDTEFLLHKLVADLKQIFSTGHDAEYDDIVAEAICTKELDPGNWQAHWVRAAHTPSAEFCLHTLRADHDDTEQAAHVFYDAALFFPNSPAVRRVLSIFQEPSQAGEWG